MLGVVKPHRLSLALEHRDHVDFSQSTHDEKPKFDYDVSKALNEMTTLTDRQLQQWYERHIDNPTIPSEYALDELYRITFPNK